MVVVVAVAVPGRRRRAGGYGAGVHARYPPSHGATAMAGTQ